MCGYSEKEPRLLKSKTLSACGIATEPFRIKNPSYKSAHYDRRGNGVCVGEKILELQHKSAACLEYFLA